MKRADVAITGAGPAGSVAAMILARAGLRVVIFDKSDGGEFRVGESLPPDARLVLKPLGLLEQLEAGPHLRAYANRSAWGAEGLGSNDFIFNPYGHGWHLDRRAFNTMLAGAAEAAGATLLRSTRFVGASEMSGGWALELDAGGRAESCRVNFVFDCSGRDATFAQKRGARRITYDRLVGVVALSAPAAEGDADSATLVEAAVDGWWYTALLPGGKRVTVYHTDADLLRVPPARLAETWPTLLGRTEHVRGVHERYGYELVGSLRVVAANSSRLDLVKGGGWLAAGDAAAAFDPLSSQGIMSAMRAGANAAGCYLAHRLGEPTALGDYAAHLDAVYDEYLSAHAAFYAQAAGRHESPFWARRSAGRLTGRLPSTKSARRDKET